MKALKFVFVTFLIISGCTNITKNNQTHEKKDTNCAISLPPSHAGSDFHMGAEIKVYPLASSIDKFYTGCQTLWVNEKQSWNIFTKAYFRKGNLVYVEIPSQMDDQLNNCEFNNGEVIKGDSALCQQLTVLYPYKSFTYECIEESKSESKTIAKCSRE